MEKKFHAITVSGAHYTISEETASRILSAGNQDLIEFDDGSIIKVSGIMEVLPHDAYSEQFPEKVSTDMHQPYSFTPDAPGLSWDEIKSLPAQGYDKLLNHPQLQGRENRSSLDRFIKGLETAKKKIKSEGGTTLNIDKMIEKAKLNSNVK